MNIIKILALKLILIFFCWQSYNSMIYYVDENGDDENGLNTCVNLSNPCKSIKNIFNRTANVDSIEIRILSNQFFEEQIKFTCDDDLNSSGAVKIFYDSINNTQQAYFMFDQIYISNCNNFKFLNLKLLYSNQIISLPKDILLEHSLKNSSIMDINKLKSAEKLIDFESNNNNNDNLNSSFYKPELDNINDTVNKNVVTLGNLNVISGLNITTNIKSDQDINFHVGDHKSILNVVNSKILFENCLITNSLKINFLDSDVKMVNNSLIIDTLSNYTNFSYEYFINSHISLLNAHKSTKFNMLNNRIYLIASIVDSIIPNLMQLSADNIFIDGLNISTIERNKKLVELRNESLSSSTGYIYLNARNRLDLRNLDVKNIKNLFSPLIATRLSADNSFVLENSKFYNLSFIFDQKNRNYYRRFAVVKLYGENYSFKITNTTFDNVTSSINVIVDKNVNITYDNVFSNEASICPPGYYSLDSTICDLCQPGFYNDIETTDSSCKSCSPGTFSDIYGSVKCTPCYQGTFCDVKGCSFCRGCYSEYVLSNVGQASCNKLTPFLVVLILISVLLILFPTPILLRYILVRVQNK